jgi:ubiquinone/menaquinone biosynthesis C-methylase UbiE
MDYDDLAAVYVEHRRAVPEVLKGLQATSAIDNGSRILEVGCGTGNYISALRTASECKAWGVDPSEEMLASARSSDPRVHFSWGRGETLRFEDEFFDLVLSVDVIHHIADRAEYLSEAFRVLRPGGRICTVTDNEWIIRNRLPLSGYFPDTVEPELARYPTEPELRREMAWAGFRDIVGTVVEHHYELDDVSAYKARAFSSLHLISDEALARGVRRMKLDMELGPIPCVARYLLLWGRK